MEIIKNIFKGRMKRMDYFMMILQITILSMILMYFMMNASTPVKIILTIINYILSFFSLAFTVRRLHDINKSGYFSLILVLPFIAMPTSDLYNILSLIMFIFIIFLCIKKGGKEKNKYGNPPKKDTKLLELILNNKKLSK